MIYNLYYIADYVALSEQKYSRNKINIRNSLGFSVNFTLIWTPNAEKSKRITKKETILKHNTSTETRGLHVQGILKELKKKKILSLCD